MTKKSNLRNLALSASQSFRTERVNVPEWGIDVLIREPSSQAWIEWQGKTATKNDDALSEAEKVRYSMEMDVILFIDILLEEDGTPVFTEKDRESVLEIYGPVHSRLLRRAFDLSITHEEAEKK